VTEGFEVVIPGRAETNGTARRPPEAAPDALALLGAYRDEHDDRDRPQPEPEDHRCRCGLCRDADAYLRDVVRGTLTERVLTVADVAALLGIAESALPDACRAIVAGADLRYEVATGMAAHTEIVAAAQRLATCEPVGPHRQPEWDAGWADVAARYRATGNPATLLPQYVQPAHRVLRFRGQYIWPVSPEFEPTILTVIQAWYATTWLKDAPVVCEFGCGPGHNLAAFARHRVRSVRYFGLDWSLAAVALVREIGFEGRLWDLRAPTAAAAPMPFGAAVVTCGALEQLGADWRPFFDYLARARPAVVVHLEPFVELYDPTQLFDFVADYYHRARGYLAGYLTHLREQEQAGAVEILHLAKHLGSRDHDGWTTCVWRFR